MKVKLLLAALLLITNFSMFAQSSMGKLYKSDRWGDAKRNSEARALYSFSQNPTIENVEILQTAREFKVTLGKKILIYKIVSFNQISDVLTTYSVTAHGKSYKIGVAQMPDATFAIGNSVDWFVGNISDISTVKVE